MTQKPRILIVDDDEGTRRSLTLIFNKKGYETKTAETGKEGIKKAQDGFFNLALLDIKLPDMEGVELLRPLKNLQPDLVPIMVTGHASMATAVKALNEGAKAYINKPLNMDEVLAKIEDVLERQHLVFENRNLLDSLQHELTEKNRAELALKDSEEKYRELVENANSIIFRTDTQGRFTFVNEFTQKFFGYSEDELLGKSLVGTIVPETGQNGSNLESMIKDITVHPDLYASNENENMKKNGERVWVSWANKSIYDDTGKVSGILSVGNDITARKRAEEELQLLSTAIEHAAESVMITDQKGTIQYVNPAFEKIAGFSRMEALGQNPRLLQSGKHDHAFYAELWDTISKGGVWQGQFINKRKDGSLYEEEASISPVLDNKNEITHFVAVKRDVSDQLNLEKQFHQAQKMEAIGTLAGGIAHDFNNILYAVIGFAELAMEELPEDSPVRAKLDQILTAGGRARDLVKQILTLSRQTEAERMPLQVNHIVREALKLLRPSFPTTIEFRHTISTSALVHGDAAQIHQVLMNLCTNAYHAMREKGGVLSIDLCEVSIDSETASHLEDINPGRYIKLSVGDTGYGIVQVHVDKIFEPYFTTKERGEGTGLGLSVVHGAVKSHGGAISVYSEPDQGTTFHVFLPIIEDGSVKTPTTVKPIPKGDERLLLVDDELNIVELEKQMLQRLGYRVTTRNSSPDALNLFRERPDDFDLVITDFTMPTITGDRLAKEFMKIRSDIPIILCTGFSERISEEQAKAMGIRDFVMKPIVRRQMAETVRRVLDEG